MTSAMPPAKRPAGGVPFSIEGVGMPAWFRKDTSDAFRAMDVRKSDVFLLSYPKTGTHWLHKIVSTLLELDDSEQPAAGKMQLVEMLVKDGKAKEEKGGKFPHMWVDNIHDDLITWDEYAAASGRRVFSTHSPPRFLPDSLRTRGRGKVIYIMRNPKDALVSSYFFRGIPKDGWSGAYARYMTQDDSVMAFGSYFTHLTSTLQWAAGLPPLEKGDNKKEANEEDEGGEKAGGCLARERVLLVHFEDLKRDAAAGIRRIASFLGLDKFSDENLAKVVEASSFNTMKSGNASIVKGLFRSGKKGGWTEHFSEEQSAAMDALFDAATKPVAEVYGATLDKLRADMQRAQ